MSQLAFFDGYELQARYLKVPGVDTAFALARVLPEGAEGASGDFVKFEAWARMQPSKPGPKFNDKGEVVGEVAMVYVLVPITDTVKITDHRTKEEEEARAWAEDQGATA